MCRREEDNLVELEGGRILHRQNYWERICIHEKHWTKEAEYRDEETRMDPDICWECIDAVRNNE